MAKNENVDPEELVEFMIPSRGPEEREQFIGVNGQTVAVKPGEPVKIKRKFVEAYENSIAQERAAWKAQKDAQNLGRKPLAEL